MKLARLAALIFIPLFAAACVVENEHTIITNAIKADDRLDGVWAFETDGTATLLVIGREENEFPVLRGRLIMSDKKETTVSSFVMSFTEIGRFQYLEVNNLAGDAPFKPQVKRFFARWEINDDSNGRTLKFCYATAETFKELIEKKILPGYAGEGNNPRVILSSTTEATRAYLEKNPLSCESGLIHTYRRISGPQQKK